MVTIHLSSRHSDFPAPLLDLPAAGFVRCEGLYIRGAWPTPQGVAIVGTREPTPAAVEFTRALVDCVVGAGWAVWSGGARGIDGAAHEAALAAGGATVMVSPCGLDVTYPPEHEDLFDRITASGGTLLGPFADGAPPTRPAFLRRNAILAALTIATVVVQAPVRSGARSTAHAARKLGRPLFVVPYAPWEERGAGCLLELELGARPFVRPNAFVAALRGEPPPAQLELPLAPREGERATGRDSARAAPVSSRAHAHAHVVPDLSDEARRVLEAMDQMPAHADDLCERTSLPFATVTAALLTLTLQAVVVEAPAGFYRRRDP